MRSVLETDESGTVEPFGALVFPLLVTFFVGLPIVGALIWWATS